ncbi:Lysine ketoglutarate reductase trans-splicing protein [Heracleum sosnowskyi]|uniref:Lysine ketoglutarate reductase trans-splicing protein n=1 Tax=Heracleum sosnowskyi TaxID=360622 RepID=A0AAD8H3B6_9APIA|nr:Lysine ketoglutarate reductase trans-splicing protein [Heracleum sosnowskyi]
MEPWLLFVALCSISTGYFIGSSIQTLPTNKITKIYSGSSTCYILESEIASSGQEFRTNNKTSIYVATNPRGAEGLPPDIVEPYSDLYFNELLTSSRKESVVKPKYLLALTVGYNQKEIVDKMVSKFSENFSIVLFHYDGRASAWEHFEWSRRAIHISSEKQTKWWYAKRFLHPHIVAGYEYMFIWDEDIGVENFNADEYVNLAKKYRLDISQPAIESKAGLTWPMTQKRNDVEAHKEAKGQECPYPHSPPCAGFVEIMVPVFSIKSWSCVWRMLQNDLVHGWGLDLNLWRCVERPQEDIGVIDAQWVEHMSVPSLGDQGTSINGSAPWEGVRARCFLEWREFERRLREQNHLHSGSL